MELSGMTSVRRTMYNLLPEMTADRKAKTERFTSEYLDAFDPGSVQIDKNDPRIAITPEQKAVHDKANVKQADQNSAVAMVLRDPRAFKKDLEARFQAQKAITPEDPYQFELKDYGIPVLQDIEGHLSAEIGKLEEKMGLTPKTAAERTGVKAAFAAIGDFFNPFQWMADKNYDVGLKYLKELKADVGGHIKDDSISYRRLQELAAYSATALGHFDDEDLNLKDRSMLVIDRHLLGKESGSIAEEYQRYKDNDFQLFRKEAGDSGIRMAQDHFVDDFFNPDQLKLVSLPVARSLGPGVFMQLLPHDMFLMGVTPEPESADGFNRPGGDFYLHDMRHSSSIYTKRKIYEKEHNLSDSQKEKLEVMQSVWKAEMNEEKKKIESKEMRYAIGFLGFNHHHDRGIPQLPSSFLAEDHGKVANKLHLALRVSEQPIGFDNPKQTINEAYDWLKNFWLERLPQEEAILAASDPTFSQSLKAQAEQAVAAAPNPSAPLALEI